jgi:predicted RNA-binding protein with PIN domain
MRQSSVVADPTLYLFDGYNLLHAGSFRDVRELRDTLASFVAIKGARGVLVLDGAGRDEIRGPLEVRHAPHADALLERLASENRSSERVCVVSSDSTLRATAGRSVQSVTSQTFLGDLEAPTQPPERPSRIADRLDPETFDALERLRRGGQTSER